MPCYTLYIHFGHTMRSRTDKERVLLGRWTQQDLERMIMTARSIANAGRRIEFISRQFLGTPYQESTLIGGPDTPELLTINLEGVDCFTFLDYVEAMRLSSSFSQFKETVRNVRYRSGKVAYTQRNHFFTDWLEMNTSVGDVTGQIGGSRARVIRKRLNEKADGTGYLAGIPVTDRAISYIPTELIDSAVMGSLQTGDYVGTYAETEGLDVSHVGIIVKNVDVTYLRHASSIVTVRKVIDQEFASYIAAKPGIVTLRPHE